LRYPIAAGPAAQRAAIDGGAMLYDGRWSGNLQPSWFEADHWRKSAAIEGAARGRGTTWFLRTGPDALVLRHYQRGGLVAKWLGDRYWFEGAEATRPFREWSLTWLLHGRGLPVPEPVAARYRSQGSNWYSGDLLTRRIPNTSSLAELLARDPVSLPRWIAIGRCLRRFHDALVYHADLNAHNILIDESDTVFLIDFDRGHLCSQRGVWCDRNLARLRRSLDKIQDRLPPGRFGETDWYSLLAGYRSSSAS
jgi:3-deoxy-D-manno-octulosonic acid kinase